MLSGTLSASILASMGDHSGTKGYPGRLWEQQEEHVGSRIGFLLIWVEFRELILGVSRALKAGNLAVCFWFFSMALSKATVL